MTDRLQKSDLVALLKKLNMTPIQLARRNERGFVKSSRILIGKKIGVGEI